MTQNQKEWLGFHLFLGGVLIMGMLLGGAIVYIFFPKVEIEYREIVTEVYADENIKDCIARGGEYYLRVTTLNKDGEYTIENDGLSFNSNSEQCDISNVIQY